MWTDVIDLNDFYQSDLGQVARRLIRRRIRALWPDVRGMRVLGMGYAVPYLRPFRDEAERVLAVMPANQGVMHWPAGEAGLVALADEAELPFPDLSVDRLLLVHAVECSEQLRPMLREAWRVLSGDGRLLVVVPNRRGIWARLERSPFGNGHPFNRGQIRRLLRDCLFTPVQTARALYIPPSSWPVVLHAAPAVEKVGDRWFQPVSGVLMVEACKQIYAATPIRRAAQRRRRLVVVPNGATARGLCALSDQASATAAASASASGASITLAAVS